jgi:sulfoxide reductase heme-binding subunit YedZ
MMIRALKVLVFVACLGPLGYLVYGVFADALGANPIDVVTDQTGTWTLRFLVATLLVTPLRRLIGWNPLIRFRRMLGLFAFFYGSLHFLTYLWLDQFFDVPGIVSDIAERPFITVGFAAFTLMVPLAVTSTAGWIRRLGGRRWALLHRLVYASAILGVIHYWWLVKADIVPPARYAAIVAVLLAVRVWFAYNARHAVPASPSRARSAGRHLSDAAGSSDLG